MIGKQRAGVTGRVPAYYDPRALKWEFREIKPKPAAQGKLKISGNGKEPKLEAVPLPQEEDF